MSERHTLAGSIDADDPDAIRCVIMAAGPTTHGLTFAPSVLETAAGLFHRTPVYIDHAADIRPGGRSVRDLAGVLTGPHYQHATADLRGDLHLYPPAAWLRDLIANAKDLPNFGLSAVVWLDRDGPNVTAIRRVESVDVVMNPAAGGRFANAHLGGPMPEDTANANPPPEPAATAAASSPDPTPDEMARRLDALSLDLQLERSGLPDNIRRGVRTYFAAHPYEEAAAQAYIDNIVAAYRHAAEPGIRGLGTITDVVEPLDRIQMAADVLLGAPVTDRHTHAPRLSGIRELYDILTGDYERHGVFRGDRVQFANVTTLTMAEVCRNALNKVLLAAFEARPKWWAPVAREEDFINMQTARWLTVGGIPDLAVVAEGGPYVERTWDDYAETSDFAKRGNYIGITLEMIDRDDVGAIRILPRRLAHAAYRTLSASIAGVFTAPTAAGVVLADTNPLFDALHGNTGVLPLSAANWNTVAGLMYKQLEFHSARRLAVRPRYCMIPIDLEKTALEIFTSDRDPDGLGAITENVLKRNASNIVVVPDWIDATDWVAAADPADLEGLCVGYRFGRAPELFVADENAVGSMFTNDEMRIKVRFVYTVGIGDYRALHKNIVP